MDEKIIERGNTALAVKSGFWYVFSTIITKGLAFITTPIFARLMSKSDYGEFSNIANWQSLLLIIVSAEMYNTLSRAYYDYTDDFDGYTSTVTLADFFIVAVVYCLFLAFRKWIYHVVSIPNQFIHLVFFNLFFQGSKQVFLARERALYRYRSVAKVSLLSLGVPTVVSILAVFFVPESQRLSARLYGFYIPYALIGAFCAVDLLRHSTSFRLEYLKYAIALSLPLLIHYLTTYLLASSNTIVTKIVLGPDKAALVSLTTSIMNILTVVFQAVTGAMTIWMMDNLKEKEYAKIRKGILVFTVGVALITLCVILLGPEIVLIVGGKAYLEITSLIPGLAFATALQVLTTAFTIILTYDKNVLGTAVVTGVIAVVSVVGKVLLLPRYGYNVLAVINTVAFTLAFLANYYLVRKAGYKECVNIPASLSILSVLAVAALHGGTWYSFTLLRYGLVAGICIAALLVMYKHKDKLISFINKRGMNNA